MNQEFIAFISYRHNPVDTAAAMAIQKKIERYKIPRELRKKGSKRLGMVFRDEDELNISANLSASLRDALDHSRYLIVICSPEYKKSNWCLEEIHYFLQHHDIEQVLPVLVAGSPRESFPEELYRPGMVDGVAKMLEPLAADVRADSIDGIPKKVAKQYLHIAARLLDCDYDDLVQRQQRYERRQRRLVSGVILSVLLAFIGMLLVKNHQIYRQYQQTRRNQARNLAAISLDQYEKGYRLEALESALTILPEKGEKGPMVPEQTYALSTAVNPYNMSYVPEQVLPLKDGDRRLLLQDQDTYYVYSSDELHTYSLSDQTLQHSFRLKDYIKAHPDLEGLHAGYSSIEAIEAMDENRFIMQVGRNLFYVDLGKEAPLERIYLSENPIRAMSYAEGNLALADAAGRLIILNLDHGEMLCEWDFNEESETTQVEYSIRDISWNEEGTSLAIGLRYEYQPMAEHNRWHDDLELNKEEMAYSQENLPYGTLLLNLASREMLTLSNQLTDTVNFEGEFVVAEHIAYPESQIKTYPAAADPIRHFYSAVYSAEDGSCIFTGDVVTAAAPNTFGSKQGIIDYDGQATRVCLVWLGNKGLVLDMESREILFLDGFHSDIIYMGTYEDDGVDIVLANGSVQHMKLKGETNLRITRLKLDMAVEEAWGRDGSYYLKPMHADHLIRCRENRWQGYREHRTMEPGLEQLKVSEITYQESKKGVLRIVRYQDPEETYRSDSICSGFEIYSTNSEEMLFSYLPQAWGNRIVYVAVSEDGSVVTILEQDSEFHTILSRYSLEDGSLQMRQENDETKEIMDPAYMGSSQDRLSFLWFIDSYISGNIWYYDLSENAPSMTGEKVDSYGCCPILTADDRYLVWLQGESEEACLAIYDRSEKAVSYMKLPQETQVNYKSALMPLKGSTILMDCGGAEIWVVDVAARTYLPSLEVGYGSRITYLSGSDELVIAHDCSLDLMDFESRRILSSLNLDQVPTQVIADSSGNRIEAKIGASYRSSDDNGWNLASSYLIYIDENRKMYLQFHIMPYHGKVYYSPSGEEIALVWPKQTGAFYYDHLLSFEELVEKAQALLTPDE